MTQVDEKQFLSPEELGDRWGFHYRTILNYINNGDIKAFKVKGQWRVSMDEVLKKEREGLDRL